MSKNISGIINVDKPPGITSMDIIRRIRRASGLRRVGHSGTLDPLASGVMVVALGMATRLLEYITAADKSYNAIIEIGKRTDTYDAEGTVIDVVSDLSVNECDIQSAIEKLKGCHSQIPPMHSAIKVNGVKLYELARKGISINRTPRPVILHDASICNFESPDLRLEIKCSKGFYIRTFANDLGIHLETGAYLKKLVRTSIGEFNIVDSSSLDLVEEKLTGDDWGRVVQTMETALNPIRKLYLSVDETEKVQNGIPIPAETHNNSETNKTIAMALKNDGSMLAIMRLNKQESIWHPEKVFHDQMQNIN
ncbi:MAG: tRNA pseudouridine(55) synthase TruB [Dehalococcoidia bacterium]